MDRFWSPRIASPTSAWTRRWPRHRPSPARRSRRRRRREVSLRQRHGRPARALDAHPRAGHDHAAGNPRAVSGRSVRLRLLPGTGQPRRGAGRRGNGGARRRPERSARDLPTERATSTSRTATRSKATSKTSRGSTSRTASSLVVHPAPWYIGLRRPSYFADTTTGTSVGRRRGRRQRPTCRRRSGHGVADPHSVELGPASRRQRLLHVGHRTDRSASRRVDRDDGRDAGAAARFRCPKAASTSLRATARDAEGHQTPDRHAVLRHRRGLHRVAALRSQPHHARAGEEDVEAGRDGARS